MILTVVYVCSLLTVFTSKQIEDCTEGYFGAKCEFKCHCKRGMCSENGICRQDMCHDSFFGPSCQYLDLMVQQSTSDNPDFVRDHDEKTCNPEHNQEYMEITMTTPIILYWIRVYINKPTLFTEGVPFFNIIIDLDGKCVNRQVFLGPNYMDVTCTAIMMSKLSLMGKFVGSICSIYFSGGRNVAIMQKATQSSTWQDDEEKAGAQNAVDGSTNNDFESSESCSRTKNDDEESTWSVTFNYSQSIFSVVIFSELEETESVLAFSLHAHNSAGATVYASEHNEASGISIRVSPPPMEPISSIVITLASNVSNNVLTLCEVQVFAETICPEGLYGLACDKPCSCRYANMCHVVNGLCSSPELRSEQKPAEIKETMTVCPDGTYGDNCSLLCPAFCVVPSCDRLTGNCKTCDKKHLGDKCEECANNNYGPACSQSCPRGCLDSCDPETGNCHSCQSSFSGPKCDQVTTSRVLILLIGTIVLCVGVFLVVTYFLRRQRLKDADSESGESSIKGTQSSQMHGTPV